MMYMRKARASSEYLNHMTSRCQTEGPAPGFFARAMAGEAHRPPPPPPPGWPAGRPPPRPARAGRRAGPGSGSPLGRPAPPFGVADEDRSLSLTRGPESGE